MNAPLPKLSPRRGRLETFYPQCPGCVPLAHLPTKTALRIAAAGRSVVSRSPTLSGCR